MGGSGRCDIEATENSADRVYGVIFRIATAEERALDEAEGIGPLSFKERSKTHFRLLTSN
jgi:hypothetical protein